MIEERNSLVYDRFIIPVELHYYGITDDLEKRGKSYKSSSLQQYIDEYGWDNITTTIVSEGLTRKEAERLEDKLIKEGWKNGNCINQHGSGGEWRDNCKGYKKQYYQEHKELWKLYEQEHEEERKNQRKEYYKQHKEDLKLYREKHKEHILNYQKQYDKQRYSSPEGKIYNRVKNYNRFHTLIETPLEAKRKYLETGYIPSYIKNNDLK